MNLPTEGTAPLQTEADIVFSRQTVRKLSQALGFSLVDQTKLVTAASELARNTLIHGRGGVMRWQVVENGSRSGLRLCFEDRGPGIPDVHLALKDGWTSGTGLGMGLPGAKRLVNEFDLQSQAGHGTRVTVTRWS